MPEKIHKKNSDWKAQLSSEQYRITREGGTEMPYTGKLVDNKETGTYTCVCCNNALFLSGQKFDSQSGWPSFWAPADENTLNAQMDTSHGMRRTEVKCAICDAHLGHEFDDGPEPTGKRYCINSAALAFIAK